MALLATPYEHIVVDEEGFRRIAGTKLRVIDLVEAKRANGWTPEQLHNEHPELTLGQIYSALAYYWNHQEELDAAIADRQHEIEELKRQTRPSQLVERLRQDRRLRGAAAMLRLYMDHHVHAGITKGLRARGGCLDSL